MSRLYVQATVACDTDDQTKIRIEDISRWDLSGVERSARARLGWSKSYTRTVANEYKKFFVLVSLNPDKNYGMAGDVDQIWHDHILNTVDYSSFCEKIFGNFVHHVPGGGPQDSQSARDLYEANTLADYRKIFGSVSEIWPTHPSDGEISYCCKHIAPAAVH